VQVHFTHAPAGGFVAFDVVLAWQDTLEYLPTPDTEDELLWPECDAAPRSYTRDPAVGPWLIFGCLPVPQQTYTATGAILQFEFECAQAGAAVVELQTPKGVLSPSPDVNGRSRFANDRLELLFPALSPATITCA
jgi:hypothetical protein